jgi:signal transduction histidine kinase
MTPGAPETHTTDRPSAGVALPTHRTPWSVIAIVLTSIVLLIINASLLVINTAETMESNAEYGRSYEIKRSLSAFQTVITTAESGQRGYLLTGQTAYLDPYYRAMNDWRTQIERVRGLTTEDATRQRDIAELEQLTAAAISDLEQTIKRSPQPGPSGNADVAGTDRATIAMDRVRSIVDRMVAEEDARIEALGREVVRDLWVMVGVAVITTVVLIAVLIGLLKLLQRYVAARVRAEHALREANQDLNQVVEERTAELASLSQHLIRVAEEEKSKLARELHDTLGSNLTAINMDLNWILRRMHEDQRELRERLQRTLQLLAETVELKQQVIEGLRPSQLDSLGLSSAVRSHCREFTRRTGLPCDLDMHEDFEDLDPDRSISLYRITQEALTNIVKHAQAGRVRVMLKREADGVRLRIVDDGVGIASESLLKPKSYGLAGMRERMRQVGGRVTVTRGANGKGTAVDAFVPIKTQASVEKPLRHVG